MFEGFARGYQATGRELPARGGQGRGFHRVGDTTPRVAACTVPGADRHGPGSAGFWTTTRVLANDADDLRICSTRNYWARAIAMVDGSSLTSGKRLAPLFSAGGGEARLHSRGRRTMAPGLPALDPPRVRHLRGNELTGSPRTRKGRVRGRGLRRSCRAATRFGFLRIDGRLRL